MAWQGILLILSGFAFIFAPGVPMGLLGRRTVPLNRDLIYWGLGLWLAALLPSLFVQSVLRQALLPEASAAGPSASTPALALLGALVTAVFVQAAMYFVLRWKCGRSVQPLADGLPLGFGVGLLPQIFNGIGLVSAGVGLLFSGVAAGPLAGLANVGLFELVLILLSLVAFRPALLVVSAACGVLVARAVAGDRRLLGAAILVDAVFATGAVLIQMALSGTGSGLNVLGMPGGLAAAVLLVYYGLAFALAFAWLAGQMGRRALAKAV